MSRPLWKTLSWKVPPLMLIEIDGACAASRQPGFTSSSSSVSSRTAA